MLTSVAARLAEVGRFKIKKGEVQLVARTAWEKQVMRDQNSTKQVPAIAKDEKQRSLDEENRKLHQIGESQCKYEPMFE